MSNNPAGVRLLYASLAEALEGCSQGSVPAHRLASVLDNLGRLLEVEDGEKWKISKSERGAAEHVLINVRGLICQGMWICRSKFSTVELR